MSAALSLTDVFGPVIHAYTRADAIADGALVDVSETAREAGFTWPVALTAAAHADAVAWDDDTEARKPHFTGQCEAGRLWDVLTMARLAIANARHAGNRDTRAEFTVIRVPAEGRGLRARPTLLVLHAGPGDAGEPVLTIMLPGED